MCADHRIGNQFLYPGLGFGGSCFPKDTRAVMGMGNAVGYSCRLMDAVNQVNQEQRAHFWKKILDHFGPGLAGRTLAFWGAAFKPETDDIREAPALTLARWALEAGAAVRAYDPIAGRNLARAVPGVSLAADMYDALEGADALVVCTEWSEFRNPDFKQMGTRLRQRVIFDGRNIYRRQLLHQMGFTYYAVGRPPVIQPEHTRGQRLAERP
jgi:UDPglucose 6-dehydrogenase